jgi:alkylhydroperoxidase/carboxymuconolactone decarboxylase family protein YurZ
MCVDAIFVTAAAAALQQAGIVCGSERTPAAGVSANVGDTANAVLSGEAAFDAIYGRAAVKVRTRIANCHPLLDAWVIRWVYGEVLSEPGPSLRERELCAVAVLAGGGPGTEPLLVSHCRGALRCGATPEELRAVIDHTEHVFGADAAERAEGVWTTYDRARNAL